MRKDYLREVENQSDWQQFHWDYILPMNMRMHHGPSEEITLLKKIKHLPLLEIQRQLPWRSLSSISHKLEREGLLKKSRWSKEEIDILKKYDGCPPIGLLNRSECAIQHKVSKLGLQREKRWTDEEIEILKKYGNDVPPGLLDRSKIAIRGKLQKLKEQGCTDGIKRV